MEEKEFRFQERIGQGPKDAEELPAKLENDEAPSGTPVALSARAQRAKLIEQIAG